MNFNRKAFFYLSLSITGSIALATHANALESITNAKVTGIASEESIVEWDTDIPVKGQACCDYEEGGNPPYCSAPESQDVTHHRLAVPCGHNDGNVNAIYYKLFSTSNAAGKNMFYNNNSYSDSKAVDIGNLAISNIAAHAATVSWESSLPSSCDIYLLSQDIYSASGDFEKGLKRTTPSGTKHSVAFDSLAGNANYYFKIKCFTADRYYDIYPHNKYLDAFSFQTKNDGSIASVPATNSNPTTLTPTNTNTNTNATGSVINSSASSTQDVIADNASGNGDGTGNISVSTQDAAGAQITVTSSDVQVGTNGTDVANDTPAVSNVEVQGVKIDDPAMFASLKGKIIIKTEDSGKAYYINPVSQEMFYLGRPIDALRMMRQKGVGIRNADLQKIRVGFLGTSGQDTDGDGLTDLFENAVGTNIYKADSDGDGYSDKEELQNGYSPVLKFKKLALDDEFGKKRKGMIFLQVEGKGEAWYVNPDDGRRYFLGRPADALKAMKVLGLGISNTNYDKLAQ